MITAVRGATTVEMNDKEMIYEASAEMMKEIIERNNIDKDDIVSIVFTATSDLDKAYPAVAVRQMGITEAEKVLLLKYYRKNSELYMLIRAQCTVPQPIIV